MNRYAWVTADLFDAKLRELAEDADLLDIPGVYELVREYLNNEVLEALEEEREDDDPADNLSRDACVAILERAGIQCYDDEDTATLREAVRVNLDDGTLTLGDLYE